MMNRLPVNPLGARWHRLAGCVAILLLLAPASFAGRPSRTVTTYKVSSFGMAIGDLVTSQRLSDGPGRGTVQFETRTRVKADLLWLGYSLDSSEKGTLRDGELVSYSRKGEEDGAPFECTGELQGESFSFVVRENGLTRRVNIPRGSYDHTTMGCPEALIDFAGRSKVTLRILDMEKQSVVNREYRLVATESCRVAGRDYPCRVVDFSDRNTKARRWVSADGTGIVVFRQEGKDLKSSYSVQAISLKKET